MVCFVDAILKNTYFTDWIVQCFTSPPTQYRLYGRRFLQVKRPYFTVFNREVTLSQGKHTDVAVNLKLKALLRKESVLSEAILVLNCQNLLYVY